MADATSVSLPEATSPVHGSIHAVFYEPGPSHQYAPAETGDDASIIVKDDTADTRVDDIQEEQLTSECQSTAAVLHYCERKFLKPYLCLLAVIGLRQPCSYSVMGQQYLCGTVFGFLHILIVILLLISGYVLQGLSCFRRDRGFDYNFSPNGTTHYQQICYGSLGYSYVVPSVLHFLGYCRAFHLFVISQNEQLQNLMERVFLSSAGPLYAQNTTVKLMKALWFYVGLSGLWLFLSGASITTMITTGIIHFGWAEPSSAPVTMPLMMMSDHPFLQGAPLWNQSDVVRSASVKVWLKVLLALTTLWQDFVQVTLITSYCLQGQLLISHLQFLRTKLLQNSLSATEWMQEVVEFQKLLKYFNGDMGFIICIFTIINITWAASGIMWLLKMDYIDQETKPIYGISILNICLWVIIAVVPFLQAARLTAECTVIQSSGHDVRRRPFVYRQTPDDELNVILLFTSSLRMKAKLFGVPITGKYLYFVIFSTIITVLTLGQCHIL